VWEGGLCSCYSPLPLERESNHRQQVNRCMPPCSGKACFTETGSAQTRGPLHSSKAKQLFSFRFLDSKPRRCMMFCRSISAQVLEDLQCAAAASLPRSDHLVPLSVSCFVVIKQYFIKHSAGIQVHFASRSCWPFFPKM